MIENALKLQATHKTQSVLSRIHNKWKVFVVVLMITAGMWQLAQGLYVHVKAELAQVLLERAWMKTRNGEQHVAPWPWADTWPIARLQVPRLGVEMIVLAGDSGRVLAFGPGYNFASVLPGETGNSFISGHRDTHFRFLKYLQNGDVIHIETQQGKLKKYAVESAIIMDANNASVLSDEINARLSLITCYPFDAINPGGSQRYIVSAVEI